MRHVSLHNIIFKNTPTRGLASNALIDLSHPVELLRYKWSQDWNHLIFLHWKLPPDLLRSLIPENLVLDTYGNSAFISIVAFTMNNVRQTGLPVIPLISDFHQVNIRTYVVKDGKPGIYIFHISAEKLLSVYFGKLFSGLTYYKGQIKRSKEADIHCFSAENKTRNLDFDVRFKINSDIREKNDLDNFLLNRYHLYQEEKGKLYRFDINREPWVVHELQLEKLFFNFRMGELNVNDNVSPFLSHYSYGINALVWKRVLLE